MTTTDELYPSRFLKVTDFDEDGGDMVLTITGWKLEELGENRDTKPVLHFKETEKLFVMNKTNCQTIEALHGKNLEAWTGKKIALYTTEVAFAGKTQLGIRVRLRAPAAVRKPVAPVIAEDEYPETEVS